jgi:hypothetical protein
MAKDIIIENKDDDEKIDVFYEYVDPVKHEEMVKGLKKGQEEIYNYVVNKMKDQERVRAQHGCNRQRPCDNCDQEENFLRLFVTGEGKIKIV